MFKTPNWKHIAWVVILTFPLPVSALSPEAAHRVFNDLVHAIGDRRTQPAFLIDPQRNRNEIAAYHPLSNQIILNARVLNFAERFGDRAPSALALVIGHELAHHYENHQLRTQSLFAPSRAIEGNAPQRKTFEAEADYFAVFFAHMAGYSTEGIDENFIRELYAAFDIGNSPHYPSLEDRIDIFRNARLEIGKLAAIFETGNLLLTLGQPSAAAHCFEQVGVYFASQEVWNNAGVSNLLAALELLPDDSPGDQLLFPVEFSEQMLPFLPEERTRQTTLAPEDAAILRINFLLKAKDGFERTLAFNDTSGAVLVNLACTYLLLGHDEALMKSSRELHRFNFRQALDKLEFLFPATSSVVGRIAVLKGIEALLGQDRLLAERFFGDANEKYGDLLGKINLNAIRGTSTPPFSPPASSSFETLHEITLFKPEGRNTLLKIVADSTPVSMSGWTYDLDFRQASLPNGNVILISYQRPELSLTTTVYALQAAAGYHGASARGIRTGATEKLVADKYGLPKKLCNSSRKSYWVYPESGVMFCFGQGKVDSIFNYFVEETE